MYASITASARGASTLLSSSGRSRSASRVVVAVAAVTRLVVHDPVDQEAAVWCHGVWPRAGLSLPLRTICAGNKATGAPAVTESSRRVMGADMNVPSGAIQYSSLPSWRQRGCAPPSVEISFAPREAAGRPAQRTAARRSPLAHQIRSIGRPPTDRRAKTAPAALSAACRRRETASDPRRRAAQGCHWEPHPRG